MAMKKTAVYLGYIKGDGNRMDYDIFDINEYTDEDNGVKVYTAILPGYREMVQIAAVKAKKYMEAFIEMDHPTAIDEKRKPHNEKKAKLSVAEKEVVGG